METHDALTILNAQQHQNRHWLIIESNDGRFVHGVHNQTSSLVTLTEQQAIEEAEKLSTVH